MVPFPWYHSRMAMNLRLSDDEALSLRAEAERTGRSQQDIIREAVDNHLAHMPTQSGRGDPAWQAHKLRPPRLEYRKVVPTIRLPEGVSSLDLLERDDRV